jgi:hypothetical protein
MVEVHTVYQDGELRLPEHLDLRTLKDSRVKVVVTVPNGPDQLLSREQQDNPREKLLATNPAELKVKIEHDGDIAPEPTPIAAARSAEEKLRAYWAMKGSPPTDRQERLLAKLAEVEKTVLSRLAVGARDQGNTPKRFTQTSAGMQRVHLNSYRHVSVVTESPGSEASATIPGPAT